jgi:hypothetical protein
MCNLTTSSNSLWFLRCISVLGLLELVIAAAAADTLHNVLAGPAGDEIPVIFL